MMPAFRKSLPYCLFFLFTIIASLADAQTVITIDSPAVAGTTVAIAGEHYRRSGYHNFFWGKHYRPEWTTAVRVPNFMLDTAKGGLKPIKEGGSRQTKGLRLATDKGREYVLRSIDKDFGNGLGDDFKGTFMARIAKDQASMGHPYAAPAIASLITPTGIYHTNPRIVYVPRQAALGKYNEEYGNQLYLFEERPDDNQEDAPSFGNSKKVIGTEKLFEKLYEDNDNMVDQKAFAKARLFDMFIGDWGRHADQWRWAAFEDGKKTIYRPIPRDRDQAFTRFDGFWPWIATSVVGPGTFLENFDENLNNVKRFNKPGRPLDRRLLNELSEDDWRTAARELQAALTDQVIERSIRQMPSEVFARSGNKIIAALKSRRDHLEHYAVKYYEYLAQHVTLAGSQKNEYFQVERLNKKETRVDIYKKNKEGELADKPYYSRVFHKDETSGIHIYSLEGNDRIRITGNEGISVTVVDPEKTDSLELQGRRRVHVSRGERFMFDTLAKKKFDFGILPLLSPAEYEVFENDPLQLFTRTGIKVSANFRLEPKPWRKDEYRNDHLLSVNWGFLRGTLVAAYLARFRHVVGKWDIQVKTRADLPSVENFFGVSNETINASVMETGGEKTSITFYKAQSTRLYGGVGLRRDVGIHHFEINPFYQYVKVSDKGNYYVTKLYDDPTVFEGKHFGGIEAGYQLRKVNSEVYPTQGIQFNVGGGYVQNLEESDRSFFKASSSVAAYIPLARTLTFAIRVGGAVLDGEADYYHMNTLGGNENLRGFPRERFFGKNSAYNNNELRWVFNTSNFFFRGRMGFLAFWDNGRIWQPGENSDTWHAGYGGGLILIPFNKVALTGTYGQSKETTHILLQAQVFF